jgi:hypothetical protein
MTRPWLSFRHSTESASAAVRRFGAAIAQTPLPGDMSPKEVLNMAKQKKLLPESRPPGRSRTDESLSLRSAETLGRVIGTLQRQLDGAMRRFSRDEPVASRAIDAPEKKATPRRRTRPRLAASVDPSPSRHPRKAATNGRRQALRSAKKTVKRAARPK